MEGKMSEYVTIPVFAETRELLKSHGSKGETYDQLIRRLLTVVDHSQLLETHYRRLGEKDQFVPLEEL
jgi:hypothetical protein